MKNSEAALWFKTNFQKQIETAIKGSPFSVDLITAIAMQETGYLWRRMVEAKKLGVQEILECCVGDTIDASGGRGVFPKDKAELLKAEKGQEMFDVARAALVSVAPYEPAYEKALKTASKFCRGFGIFQYDLQAYLDSKAEREYFLNKGWADFDACLGKALMELKSKLKQLYGAGKTSLTDTEQVYVAIVYNMGMKNFKFSKGFKQGHESDGRYYGENIFDFMRVSQSVSADVGKPSAAPPLPGQAPLPPPTPVIVTGDLFSVDVQTVLRLHSDARLVEENINARLPSGQIVHRLSGKKGDKVWEIETSFNGANFHGFVSPDFLKPATGATEVPVVPVAAVPAPASGASVKPAEGDIPAVSMPRKDGSITKRKDRAGALSLNEPGQPGRKGENSAERCTELLAIIKWLAVDKSSNLRYQPTSTATYCNIYAHDYCTLAGVYLPRVWWLPGAIEKLAKGEKVEAVYEKTIDEQRANDLFRWLRDFGARFGWRETSTLTKLQEAANLGGIGIIVARRKEDGRSGHIVIVAPEIDGQTARRNSAGEVIAPLQSQAGSTNFQFGTGKLDWWKDDRFAASAFYIHA